MVTVQSGSVSREELAEWVGFDYDAPADLTGVTSTVVFSENRSMSSIVKALIGASQVVIDEQLNLRDLVRIKAVLGNFDDEALDDANEAIAFEFANGPEGTSVTMTVGSTVFAQLKALTAAQDVAEAQVVQINLKATALTTQSDRNVIKITAITSRVVSLETLSETNRATVTTAATRSTSNVVKITANAARISTIASADILVAERVATLEELPPRVTTLETKVAALSTDVSDRPVDLLGVRAAIDGYRIWEINNWNGQTVKSGPITITADDLGRTGFITFEDFEFPLDLSKGPTVLRVEYVSTTASLTTAIRGDYYVQIGANSTVVEQFHFIDNDSWVDTINENITAQQLQGMSFRLDRNVGVYINFKLVDGYHYAMDKLNPSPIARSNRVGLSSFTLSPTLDDLNVDLPSQLEGELGYSAGRTVVHTRHEYSFSGSFFNMRMFHDDNEAAVLRCQLRVFPTVLDPRGHWVIKVRIYGVDVYFVNQGNEVRIHYNQYLNPNNANLLGKVEGKNIWYRKPTRTALLTDLAKPGGVNQLADPGGVLLWRTFPTSSNSTTPSSCRFWKVYHPQGADWWQADGSVYKSQAYDILNETLSIGDNRYFKLDNTDIRDTYSTKGQLSSGLAAVRAEEFTSNHFGGRYATRIGQNILVTGTSEGALGYAISITQTHPDVFMTVATPVNNFVYTKAANLSVRIRLRFAFQITTNSAEIAAQNGEAQKKRTRPLLVGLQMRTLPSGTTWLQTGLSGVNFTGNQFDGDALFDHNENSVLSFDNGNALIDYTQFPDNFNGLPADFKFSNVTDATLAENVVSIPKMIGHSDYARTPGSTSFNDKKNRYIRQTNDQIYLLCQSGHGAIKCSYNSGSEARNQYRLVINYSFERDVGRQAIGATFDSQPYEDTLYRFVTHAGGTVDAHWFRGYHFIFWPTWHVL